LRPDKRGLGTLWRSRSNLHDFDADFRRAGEGFGLDRTRKHSILRFNALSGFAQGHDSAPEVALCFGLAQQFPRLAIHPPYLV
jgi:hypothetical protein